MLLINNCEQWVYALVSCGIPHVHLHLEVHVLDMQKVLLLVAVILTENEYDLYTALSLDLQRYHKIKHCLGAK